MIRAKSVITYENDDIDAAVQDIKDGLEGFALSQNTVGIIQCDSELIKSGVLAAVCAELSFPTVGISTVMQCVREGIGDWCLSMLVMTSDDVEFREARTDGLNDDLFGAIKTACDGARLPEKELKMIFAYPPIMEKYAGDSYIEAFESIESNVPVFGSLFIGEDVLDYSECYTLCDGETYNREMAFLLVYGNVSPRFDVVNLSDKRVLHMLGTVTGADGDHIKEIDSRPAIDFFEKYGLIAKGASATNLLYMPLIFKPDLKDGTYGRSYARVHRGFTDEGWLISRGYTKPGTKVTIGSLHGSDVLESTKESITMINAQTGISAVIMYSCIMRRVVCGSHPFDEAEHIREWLSPEFPFIMGCSGGEICPAVFDAEKLENRYHSYSLVICML